MSIFRASLGIAAIAGGVFFSALAQAHPKLISTEPQADAQAISPTKIELRFSEALLTQFSRAKLLLTGTPGTTHPPILIDVKLSSSVDAKTMLITPAQPLATGSYRVEWRAVASDTHPVKGTLSFAVQ